MKKILLAVVLVPVVALAAVSTLGETAVNSSARNKSKHTKVCVATTPTLMPTTALYGRKGFALQNQGPATIFCTSDGSTPASDGTSGWEVSADTAWSLDIGYDASTLVMKCIAASAQVTGNCTEVVELR